MRDPAFVGLSRGARADALARKSEDAFRAADAAVEPDTEQQLLGKAQQLAGQADLAAAYTYLQKVDAPG